MKSVIIAFLILPFLMFSQSVEQLSQEDLDLLFTDEVKSENDIIYPIYRAYAYADVSGSYQVVLTERLEEQNDSIQAFCFKVDAGGHIEKRMWKLTDYTRIDEPEESAIWFWTKYATFEDFDNDGSIEPIIIYGTNGDNGKDDGRVKILIYHNGKKVGIRHQNQPLDYDRFTTVDASFYELPASIQAGVETIMHRIYDDGNAIFPAGWEDGLKKKKLLLNELD